MQNEKSTFLFNLYDFSIIVSDGQGESDEGLEEFFTDDEDDFDPEELKKECDAFLQPILAGLRFGRAPASPQPKS